MCLKKVLLKQNNLYKEKQLIRREEKK